MAKKKRKDEHADDNVAEAMHGGEHHPVVESGADIEMWTITAVALASTFFVVATVLFVQALDNRMTAAMKANKGWSTIDTSAYKSDQATRLAGYRWVDKASQTVAIPLEDAKKITAQKGLPEWAAEDGAEKPEEKPSAPMEEEAAGGAAAEEEGAGGASAEDEPSEEPVEEPVAPAPEAPEGKAPGGQGKGKGPDGPGKAPGGQGKGKGPGGSAPPAPPAAPKKDPYDY